MPASNTRMARTKHWNRGSRQTEGSHFIDLHCLLAIFAVGDPENTRHPDRPESDASLVRDRGVTKAQFVIPQILVIRPMCQADREGPHRGPRASRLEWGPDSRRSPGSCRRMNRRTRRRRIAAAFFWRISWTRPANEPAQISLTRSETVQMLVEAFPRHPTRLSPFVMEQAVRSSESILCPANRQVFNTATSLGTELLCHVGLFHNPQDHAERIVQRLEIVDGDVIRPTGIGHRDGTAIRIQHIDGLLAVVRCASRRRRGRSPDLR